MPNSVHIAVDAMGGDEGPCLSTAASLLFLQRHPCLTLTLVGDEVQIKSFLSPPYPARMHIRHAPQSVSMEDKPSYALRHKPQSSMAIAMAMVASGEANGIVSSGNTGALMAFGLYHLKSLPGIERPAICKPVPSMIGPCFLLDLGANIQCSAENLHQFALMGAALAEAAGITAPRIALLNVGAEAQKGGDLQQQAADLIRVCSDLNFIGFVEGGDIYRGKADVVVCDGFVGNVVLKASEGVAELLLFSIKNAFAGKRWRRAIGYAVAPLLRRWRAQFEPDRYNGALLVGLGGVVVKSHGSASVVGFEAALHVAFDQITKDTPRTIADAMARHAINH